MSNKPATTTAIALPVTSMSDIATAGDLLARSGMFGAKNPAEGFVIAGMCQQVGMSYLEFMETYHFFHGRVSMRADAMLGKLLEHGGNYKIISRDKDKAGIYAEFGKAAGEFSFSWEEALAEPFVYAGGPHEQERQLALPVEERKLKSKYKTPRSRMQMLWARVVSDAVRTVCPVANRGNYTPEEIADFDDVFETTSVPGEEPKPIDLAKAAQSVSADQEAGSISTIIGAKEPNPFANMKDVDESVDLAVCPVQGPMHQKPWADMDDDTLRMALDLKNPELTEQHRAYIEDLILRRMPPHKRNAS